MIEGIDDAGIQVFKGIFFAQPPIGDLRWQAPQPVKNWEGVRPAKQFGSRPMQRPIFGDMNFRSDGMSEDCLYLNVSTPAIGESGSLLGALPPIPLAEAEQRGVAFAQSVRATSLTELRAMPAEGLDLHASRMIFKQPTS